MGRLLFSWRAIAVLALAALLSWAAFLTLPDQRVRVSFLDVGQGDAILVRVPPYKVLVDGGPSPQALAGHLGQRLPFWDRRIDLVVLTHPHDDHLTGLIEVLQRYDVGGILAAPYDHDSSVYRQWRSLVGQRGVQYLEASQGQEVRLGAQARFEVLYPGGALLRGTASDPNNSSVVLRLIAGPLTVLLPGDIEEEGQRELLAKGSELASVVLKVPHQGARNSLAEGFLERVKPQIAVISVGKDNPFGHPAEESLAKLQGVRLFRTDRDGSVELETDGSAFTVRVERNLEK